MSTINEVAVVILNYKSWKDTLNEIDMCHKEIGIDYENIIVVDNASPNESKEELEKNSQLGYRFIYSAENNGYASGNNIGLKCAFNNGYKYALILNNDILFKGNYSSLNNFFRNYYFYTCFFNISERIYKNTTPYIINFNFHFFSKFYL